MKLIPKIFLYNESELNPELRAQRTLNKPRIPEIAKYLIDNQRNIYFLL
jgi:DNA sulfur modification protein DndB